MNTKPAESIRALDLSLKDWQAWFWVLGIFTLIELFQNIQLYITLSERGYARSEITGFFASDLLVREFWEMYSIALIIPILWIAIRRFHIFERFSLRGVLAHILFLVMAILVQQVLFRVGFAAISIASNLQEIRSVTIYLQNWSLIPMLSTGVFYLISIGALYGLDSYRRWQSQEIKTIRLEKHLSDARLQVLQSQLRPHFLFNTLQNISALIRTEPALAEQMISEVGDLLREVLMHRDSPLITMAEELSLVKHYLEIQKIRFGDRLRIDWKIDPKTESALVPTMILQPIVENALEHGLTAGGGLLEFSSRLEDGSLHISICDRGEVECGPREGLGIGLNNSIARIGALYGSAGSIQLSEGDSKQTQVVIVIPFTIEQKAPLEAKKRVAGNEIELESSRR